jgi:hypothetical protein
LFHLQDGKQHYETKQDSVHCVCGKLKTN